MTTTEEKFQHAWNESKPHYKTFVAWYTRCLKEQKRFLQKKSKLTGLYGMKWAELIPMLREKVIAEKNGVIKFK